eukprot:gene19442-biopygen14734
MTPPPTSSPTVSPLPTSAAGIAYNGHYLCGTETRDCGQPRTHAIGLDIMTISTVVTFRLTCTAINAAVQVTTGVGRWQRQSAVWPIVALSMMLPLTYAHAKYGARIRSACPVTCGVCVPTGAPYAVGHPSAPPAPPTASPVRTAAAGIDCVGSYLCGTETRDCGQPCRHTLEKGTMTTITCPVSGCAVTCDAADACRGVKMFTHGTCVRPAACVHRRACTRLDLRGCGAVRAPVGAPGLNCSAYAACAEAVIPLGACPPDAPSELTCGADLA